MAVVMAFLADHVMGVVASTRRNYLVEFDEYLEERGLKQRPRARRTPA
jgi:hypothetical protein